MGSDAIDTLTALKGLAAFTAIAVVFHALWVDHFGRYLEELKTNGEELEADLELSRIRMAGIGATLFQFTLFLCTGWVRTAYPLVCNVMFITALLTQAMLQAGLEEKLNLGKTAASERLREGSRNFLWYLFSAIAYLLIFATFARVSLAVAQAATVSPIARTLIVIFGSLGGIFTGLTLHFALGAVHLRRILKTATLEESELRSRLQDCFARAKLSCPDFFVIEFDRMQAANVLVAGFPSGRGIFKPALFISRAMLTWLTPIELEAVVMHEISHISLHHLRNRCVLSIGLILALILVASTLIVICALLFPGSGLSGMIGPVSSIVSFFLAFRILGQQHRFYEIEADLHAIDRFGVSSEDLAIALRKIDRLNDRSGQVGTLKNPAAFLSGAGHPATEKRIELLLAYVARKASQKPEEAAHESPESKDKAA